LASELLGLRSKANLNREDVAEQTGIKSRDALQDREGAGTAATAHVEGATRPSTTSTMKSAKP